MSDAEGTNQNVDSPIEDTDVPSTREVSRLWPQYMVTISSILLAMGAGLHFGWTVIFILRIKGFRFNISEDQKLFIHLLSPLGYLIGCPITAFLLDKIGRKFSILILALPQILAWILIANCTGVYMLYGARLSSGISESGALTSIPIYIGEISEPKIRGALGMSYGIAFMLGGLLINIYGPFVSIRESAHTSIFIPILFLVSFIQMPESPYYFIMKSKIERARNSLKILRWRNNVEQELNQITLDVQRQISEPKGFKAMFTIRSNLKAFFLFLGIRTLQQFSGGEPIESYTLFIFNRITDINIPLLSFVIIFHISLVLISCYSSVTVDLTGRKPLLLISTIGVTTSSFFMGLYYCFQHYNFNMSGLTWIPIILLRVSAVIRGLGLLAIPSLLAGELFSITIKVKATALINTYFGACIIVWQELVRWLEPTYGIHVLFYFSVFVGIGGVYLIHYGLPETKQNTLEEIQQELKRNTAVQSASE